jgi:FkbM family methyltransferase
MNTAATAAPAARAHPVMRTLARLLYGPIARSRVLTRLFLIAAGGLLRSAGDFRLKGNVINSLTSFPWPQVDLPKREVHVGAGVTIELHPHVGEFDFLALFSRDLGYEIELFEALAERAPEFDAIVEIGANVGVFTAFFARVRRDASVPVFAFEPSAEAHGRLAQNARAPGVHTIPAAVADRAGLLEFFEPEGHLTNGSLLADFAGHFSARVKRNLVPSLDGAAVAHLVSQHERVLLKIDVEGAEARVLRSLEPLIRSKRPVLVLEVLPEFEQELNALQLLQELYAFWHVTKHGLQRREALIASTDARDYILVPLP